MDMPVVILVGAAALAALAVVVVWSRESITARLQALFRRPEKPPKAPGLDHYYKRYWP